ncbi:HNH endonuclease signature motif containing protein [Mesorhizobium sp.]|uniref:HNH endonuclease signature motif containing protein n=1 Tax=Mesorhizobium sp. TaxID=1871066 RepID=UPI000FE83CD5|nr:HNH endonuclease signature motif containing protein [Mesorhizobium sp.]RWO22842.1 MAG: HNH endonuclease [Mesorhizobium sp.]
MTKRALPQFEKFIRYEPETGHFYWLVSGKKRMAGERADRPSPQGYRRVNIDYRGHSAHRIAWYLVKGVWPEFMVDHRNRDRSDNRWSNLRQATNSQNQANRPARGSLPKGVTLIREGAFQAQIKRGGKGYYLGLFDTAEAAHAAYVGAAQKHFGEFSRAA